MTWMQPQLTDPPMGPTDEIKLLQHRLLKAFPVHSNAIMLGVTESGVFDKPTSDSLTAVQNYVMVTEKKDIGPVGVLSYAAKQYLGVIVVPERHIVFSAHGMGQPDPFGIGYPADICRALDPRYYIWQPVGNWEAAAFPMKTSVDHLMDELYHLLTVIFPWQTFMFVGYSEGCLGMMLFLLRCREGDLKDSGIYERFRGGAGIGNPAREKNHSFPGCIFTGGEGMVSPGMTNTHPDFWDFASVKEMGNSRGQDVYATAGLGENAEALANQRLIWAMVWSVTIKSTFGIVAKVFKLVTSQPNWTGDLALVEAVLNFTIFAFKGLTPHTSYQFVQPIAGDPRSCFQIAIDHLNDLGKRTVANKRPS